jgi:chromosome segregation ATPase
MASKDTEVAEMEERLAEAEARIERLQSTAADAEARASTARSELATLRQELESAATARAEVEGALDAARERLREAASRYRDARLALIPEAPPDLVPVTEDLDEIDRSFEAAREMASRLREQVRSEAREAHVPVGSPHRRGPDLSSLSPEEKIRLGLERLGG